ncbi:MAG: 3'-5' exonuclease, partial [Bacilli bacterium]|nr:3'-5' exonuclease [Bacilli bacterium]
DDDQNIYEFRKSDSKYLINLIKDYNATKYELLDNYRSQKNIVALANDFLQKLSSRLKKEPIKAVRNTDGEVFITKYTSPNLSVPVVNDILNKHLSGSVCVLTETNEEAATIAGLLTKNGVSTRLIQDSTGFNIYNLEEIRFFVDSLNLCDCVYVIDDESWKNAKRKTAETFVKSAAYTYAENLIKSFEETNPITKYKTDFLQFVNESKLEDFCTVQNTQILVSTIHKAKGREFDNVFLTLKQNPTTDDKKRTVYVAMTRAKNNLYVHCCVNIFDDVNTKGVIKKLDKTFFEEPNEIVLPISYKGVHLSSFYYYENDVQKLKSGDSLSISSESVKYADGREIIKYFCYNSKEKKIVQFSEATVKRFNDFMEKGYTPQSAKVRLIVWWHETTPEGQSRPETKIVLPDIYFLKNM